MLDPQHTVNDPEVHEGLRRLTWDGIYSQVMGVLTGGAFLVAFALLLGASNKVIGLLAAIGPFTQILQIPSIYLVDWTRRRKLLAVANAMSGRVFWIVIAFIPWVLPEPLWIPVFLMSLLIFFGTGAIAGCAFNSWMRDIVPEAIRGSFFSRRMALGMAVGSLLSLAAAVAIDSLRDFFGTELPGYSMLFVIGAGAGLLGSYQLVHVPEPMMEPPEAGRGILEPLLEPFRDTNFQKLIIFLGSWNFAVNLAAPFFTVYMLQRLGLAMTWVLALAVFSQVMNVLFLRLWGRLSDRFSNKSVLALTGIQFIISILIWPFTTMPETYFLTIPLLIVIHALAGISTAGVLLCGGNIALKLAPRGSATAYLATNALVSGIAATIAPILAGVLADGFATQELSISLTWIDRSIVPALDFRLEAINLRSLDFLFILAGILGLYAMRRLRDVREEGETKESVVAEEFYGEVRKAVRHISNVAGLRHLTYFPYEVIREPVRRIRGRKQRGKPRSSKKTNEKEEQGNEREKNPDDRG